MFRPALHFAAWLACAALASASFAQGLYKSTMPDGAVVYGDKPAPGAVKVEKTVVDTSKQGFEAPSAREKAALKQLQLDRQRREATDNRLRVAEAALKEAEAALAAGKEPLPGERLGTAGGGSRLSEAYFERVKRLEAAVEQARSNLDKLRAAR